MPDWKAKLDNNPDLWGYDPIETALLLVETGDTPEYQDLPVIRFEAHVFDRRTGADTEGYFQYDPGQTPWKGHLAKLGGLWLPYHGDQRTEYAALWLAASIDMDAAYASISIGPAQIMGKWYKRLRYLSPLDMWCTYIRLDSYALALSDMWAFFDTGSDATNDAGMLDDLRNKDWETFASKYNGPGNAELYGRWLREAYEVASEAQGRP